MARIHETFLEEQKELNAVAESKKLRARVKELEGALMFYAAVESHLSLAPIFGTQSVPSEISQDKGRRARKALNKDNEQ